MALGLYDSPIRLAPRSGAAGAGRRVLMPNTSLSYRVVELPAARRVTHNYLNLYWWKHSIYALLEVDVTNTRQFIEN
jgi:hypothetical protein